jgi:hypothetical protein
MGLGCATTDTATAACHKHDNVKIENGSMAPRGASLSGEVKMDSQPPHGAAPSAP